MSIIAKYVTKEIAKKIGKEAAKCGAKVTLGVCCEVTIYFASKKLIGFIEEKKQDQEMVNALDS